MEKSGETTDSRLRSGALHACSYKFSGFTFGLPLEVTYRNLRDPTGKRIFSIPGGPCSALCEA